MDDDFDYNAIQEYEDQLYKDDGEHSQQSNEVDSDVEETILSHVYYTNVFNKQTASTTTTATVTHEPQHVVPKLDTNGASFNDVETRSTIVDKKRPARDAHGSDNDEDKSDSRYSMIRRAEIAKKSEADHDVIDLVSSSESEGEDSDGDDDEGKNAAAKNDMSVLEKGKMKATAQDLMGKEELMVTHIIDPDLLRDAEGEQEDGAEEYGYLDGEEFKGRNRYWMEPSSRAGNCFICKEPSHQARDCPERKCVKCGSSDHETRECGVDRICFKCHRKGHTAQDCKEQRNLARGCVRCGARNHHTEQCPSIWRNYVFDSSPKRTWTRWCYNCAGVGHLGDECPNRRYGPELSSAFSERNVSLRADGRYDLSGHNGPSLSSSSSRGFRFQYSENDTRDTRDTRDTEPDREVDRSPDRKRRKRGREQSRERSREEGSEKGRSRGRGRDGDRDGDRDRDRGRDRGRDRDRDRDRDGDRERERERDRERNGKRARRDRRRSESRTRPSSNGGGGIFSSPKDNNSNGNRSPSQRHDRTRSPPSRPGATQQSRHPLPPPPHVPLTLEEDRRIQDQRRPYLQEQEQEQPQLKPAWHPLPPKPALSASSVAAVSSSSPRDHEAARITAVLPSWSSSRYSVDFPRGRPAPPLLPAPTSTGVIAVPMRPPQLESTFELPRPSASQVVPATFFTRGTGKGEGSRHKGDYSQRKV